MFILEGPVPLLQTTILMPSPSKGNVRGFAASLSTLRTMDGTLHSYIKPKNKRRVLRWDFKGSRDKSLEVAEFAKRYSGKIIKATDHSSKVWFGYLTNNPHERDGVDRNFYSWTLSLEEST
jgi:hypothetical protein